MPVEVHLIRRVLVLLIVPTLTGVIWGHAAHADETSAWEQTTRDGMFQTLSDTFADLRRPPRVYWDRGLTLETEQKALAIHTGIELQNDSTWYGGMDAAVEAAAGDQWISGNIWRRVRPTVEGFYLRYWYFRVRLWFSSEDQFTLADAFIQWSGLVDRAGKEWVPTIRVGQVKEPMTIDWMNGAKWTMFGERAMFTETLVPNRTPGIRMQGTGWNKRLAYQAGVFAVNESLNPFGNGEGESVTARLTGLPWVDRRSDKRLLHLGISSSWRQNVGSVEFSARPETWLGPNVVDTGSYDADRYRSHAIEAFFQHERFAAIFEGAATHVTLHDGTQIDYRGWYAAASYFLTGPGIEFNRTLGVFGRVRPKRPAIAPSVGAGALELTARYSFIDLDDGPFPGGRANGLTFGINWYPRDNMKVTLNYTFTDVTNAYGVKGANGTLNSLLLRLQYDL
jgi:phosphate-selective porin